MFYRYFAVLFLLICVGNGNFSNFIIKQPINPKNCSTVHTGTGVTCRYEFFKYFHGGHTQPIYLIGLATGNSTKFIIKQPINPKNCSLVHTGTGVTCRYEFFKYFHGGFTQAIHIAQKTSKMNGPKKPHCSNKGFLDMLKNDYDKFSIYTKRYNHNIKQREVDGFWISGKDLSSVKNYYYLLQEL